MIHPALHRFLRYLFACICLLCSLVSKSQFQDQYRGTNMDNHLNGISFISPSTGFAAFDNYIGFTTDSGKSFSPRYIQRNNTNYNNTAVNFLAGFMPNGVTAFTANNLLVYGQYFGEPSVLLSTNGGNSWTLVYHRKYNMFSPKATEGITDMTFPGNGKTGYAVHHEGLLKTTNGGANWFTALQADNHELLKTSFPTLLTGYVIGKDKCFKTTDGGANWQSLRLPFKSPGSSYNNIDFLTENLGYISDLWQGHIYKTTDGGLSWTLMNDSEHWEVMGSDMKFVNDSTGYISARFGYAVYKTSDGGKTWETCIRNSDYYYLNYGLKDLFFYNDKIGWAAGHGEFLMMTTDGGSRTYPEAAFNIDTTHVAATSTVRLINRSRNVYRYEWFVNGALAGTSYDGSYTHRPDHEFDTVRLVVSNGIYSDTSEQIQYFVLPPPPPVPAFTGFSPATATSGTVVTLSGTNFTGATAVSFGGTPATSFQVSSSGTIFAVVGGGSSGAISITTPYGTVTLPGFTYTTRLQIHSFSPADGPVGTTVTIYGSNFSPTPSENSVYFGAMKAEVLSSASSRLVVLAPPGSSYIPVSVTVKGLTAYSTLPFVYRFGSGPITSDIFPTKTDLPYDLDNISLSVADFDLDGKPDFALDIFGSPNRMTVLRNESTNGSVRFGPRQFLVIGDGINGTYGRCIPADMNGDGKTDLVACNYKDLCYMENTSTPGSISFAPYVLLPGTNGFGPQTLAAADFNEDGKTDLVGIGDNVLKVYKNSTVGGVVSLPINLHMLLPTSFFNSNVVTSDLNGDGKPEIIFNDWEGGLWYVHVLVNTSNAGEISFRKMRFPVYNPHGTVAVGDMDGDGKPDLVVTSSESRVSVLRNTTQNGTISFAPETDLQTSAHEFKSVGVNDLNGDGKPDIVFSTWNPGRVALFENRSTPGNLVFGTETEITLLKDASSMDFSLADFDGDGKTDLANLSNNTGTILLNGMGTANVRSCEGKQVRLTSDLTGTSYQWQQNTGSGFSNLSDNAQFSGTATPVMQISNPTAQTSGALYRCLVDGVASNSHKTFILPRTTPSVQIATASTTICPGAPVTFSAMASGAGTAPKYNWLVNGASVNSRDSVFTTDALNENDQVGLEITSSDACATTPTAVSNNLQVKLAPRVVPSVRITASQNNVCEGTPVLFTAAPVNGGALPAYQWQVNGVNVSNSGSTFRSGDLKNGDEVQVLMTSSACALPAQVTSTKLRMNLLPAPTGTAGEDKLICPGSAIRIGSTAVPGNRYTWTSATGGFTSSLAQPDVHPKETTIYHLTITNNGTCTTKDTVAVIVHDVAPAIAGPDQTICSGSRALHTIGSFSISTYTYLWSSSTGETPDQEATVLIFPSSTTSYYLTQTSPEGCILKDTVTVTVIPPLPAPQISPAGSATFCEWGELRSSASTGNEWYRNGALLNRETAALSFVNVSGNYTVRYFTGDCPSAHSASVQVIVHPLPPTPVITRSGNGLTSSAATGNQWHLNGNPIPGATGNTYQPTASGNYTVRVTSNGCSSALSAPLHMVLTGITELEPGSSILIAPNPVQHQLLIRYEGINNQFQMRLFDISGKLLAEHSFRSQMALNMNGYAPGPYLVELVQKKTGTTVREMILKR